MCVKVSIVHCPDTDVCIVLYNEGKTYFSNWSPCSLYIFPSPTNSVCYLTVTYFMTHWIFKILWNYLIIYIAFILQGLISNNHPKVNQLNFCFIKATKVLYNVQENVILHFSSVEDHQSYSFNMKACILVLALAVAAQAQFEPAKCDWEKEMVCPGMWDSETGKQTSPDTCMPMKNGDCMNHCPVDCGKDMLCPGKMDPNGCKMPDACAPGSNFIFIYDLA